jgi:hypothetical protein
MDDHNMDIPRAINVALDGITQTVPLAMVDIAADKT